MTVTAELHAAPDRPEIRAARDLPARTVGPMDLPSLARPAGWLRRVVGSLLAIACWMTPSHTHAWAMAFYLLAIVFNYPHFMATIYRAYHTRAEFEKYKFVTLHVTLLLVLTGIVMHASYRAFSRGYSRSIFAGAPGTTPGRTTAY